MIDVARVDVGARSEEQVDRAPGLREVQRCLLLQPYRPDPSVKVNFVILSADYVQFAGKIDPIDVLKKVWDRRGYKGLFIASCEATIPIWMVGLLLS